MGLVAPWFLAGLAAVGLPVWFHLLRKHKSTPLPFSSLMFFERRTQSSISHRRLQYLLLFSLRTLLIILLAIAFAGPFVTGGPIASAGGRKLIVAAIDNSFSMREGNRLDQARREAIQVLSRIQPADQAQVVAFAREAQLMNEASSDPAVLRGAVQAIQPGDSRGSYGNLVRALRSIAQASRLPLEVHLFSDMQKTEMPPAFGELALPPDSVLKVHALTDSRLPNWTVETVSAPRRLTGAGKERVQATIAGFGAEAATVRASLVLNGKVLETKAVEVPAGGRASVEFQSLEGPYGLNRGEVRLESKDAFPADDLFRFSVERSDPTRILFVREARDSRSPVYFRTALDSSAKGAFAVDEASTAEAAGLNPSRYGFVVLSNVPAIPPAFEEQLRRYLREGGSVLIALGASAASSGKVALFNAAITETGYSSRQGERFQSVDWLDAAHPSIRRANRWEGVKFYQVIHVDPSGARVLARVTDQTPVLLEKQEGAGHILLFASTFDNVANDFPVHSSFVPFIEQTARYLSGLEEGASSVTVDTYYELRKTAGEGGSAEVLAPDGRRVLDLSESSKALGVALAREGYYEVRRGSGRRELLAVNADRRESDFELVPKETLALWEKTGEGAPAAAGSVNAEAQPRYLWWYVLLAAFVVAIAESLVAGRYMILKKEAA